MKKILSLVVAVSMIITLTACASSGNAAAEAPKETPAATEAATEAPAATEAATEAAKVADVASSDTGEEAKEKIETVNADYYCEDQPRIFMTNAYYTAPFCAPLHEQMEKSAKDYNVDLTIVDGKGDNNTQYEQIQSAIDEGYDGIIYFPADTAGTISIVKLLNDSGVPYSVIDSLVDSSVEDTITVFAGPNNITMGEVLGNAAVEKLADGGKVLMLSGSPGADPAIKRSTGFHNIVDGVDSIEIMAEQWVDGWDTATAMSIMQDMITTYGEDIDLVFCADDGIFQGAQQALEAAGIMDKVTCLSTGANSYSCEQIRNGKLYGAVLHSAKEEGKLGLEACIDVIKGKIKQGDSKWYQCSSPLVTKENVDEWDGIGW